MRFEMDKGDEMSGELWLVLCIGVVLGLLLGMLARWIGKKLPRKEGK